MEALDFLEHDLQKMQMSARFQDDSLREATHYVMHARPASEYLRKVKIRLIQETATLDEVRSVIYLLLISEYHDTKEEAAFA